MIKICFKCGEIRAIEQFYVHKQMADGHLGKCKECARRDALEHRLKNIDKIREYDRRRGKLPHRKKSIVRVTKRYRKKYPLRCVANQLLHRAIIVGKIKKPKKCSKCRKETKIMGHHADYYKPLDVVWVCQICHKSLHKQIAV